MQRRQRNLEPVSSVIGGVLQQYGLDKRFDEYRAVSDWPQVVGPAIAAQAQATSIRDGVLFVDVATSVWMQELMLLREQIAAQLNEYLGARVVRQIVLSIRRVPLPNVNES